jgi:hypothetical protein
MAKINSVPREDRSRAYERRLETIVRSDVRHPQLYVVTGETFKKVAKEKPEKAKR